MDTSRVSFGEMVAAAGGLGLLVLMFLPWFGGRLSARTRVRVPTKTGWESFGTLFDFLIVAAIAIAVGIAIARAMDAMPSLPIAQGLLVLGAGAVAFTIVAVRLLNAPDLVEFAGRTVGVDESRKVAGFLALAAAAAIGYGGHLQRRDELAARR